MKTQATKASKAYIIASQRQREATRIMTSGQSYKMRLNALVTATGSQCGKLSGNVIVDNR